MEHGFQSVWMQRVRHWCKDSLGNNVGTTTVPWLRRPNTEDRLKTSVRGTAREQGLMDSHASRDSSGGGPEMHLGLDSAGGRA